MMFRKLVTIIIVITLSLGYSKAQIPVGDWNIFSKYGNNLTSLVDAGNKVYFLVSGSLYSYADEELVPYTKRNKLSDTKIESIKYNRTENYLLIIYENSNIDLLYDDGTIANIPDLKNSSQISKKINSVSFAPDRIYLATEFGYMEINRAKHEIKDTHFLGESVSGVAEIGGKIVVSASKLYWAPLTQRIVSFDSFTNSAELFAQGDLQPLGGEKFLYHRLSNGLYMGEFSADGSQLSSHVITDSEWNSVDFIDDGFVVAPAKIGQSRTVRYYNNGGELTKTIPVGDTDKEQLISTHNDGNILWSLTFEGIQQLKIEEDGSATVMGEPFKPDGYSVEKPTILRFNRTLGKLLVTNQAETKFIFGYDGNGCLNLYKNGSWEDITPAEVPCREPQVGALGLLYSPVFDPDDPEVLYVGTWYNGVYKLNVNGEVLAHHSYHNAPIQGYGDGWMYNIPGLQFDKDGNLWIVEGEVKGASLMMLPKEKKNEPNTTADDWYTFDVNGFDSDHATRFLLVQRTNVKLLCNGKYGAPLVAFDDNGTPDNSADDRVAVFNGLTDQDGNTFKSDYITCFAEDKNGRVWMGTDIGIVELNTANIFNSNFRINHLKVPRNDGTNFADYLLANTHINSIAVDESNRKWVATQSSGVFLVNPEGSEVLEHFTTENSYLPSDKVYGVVCNSGNNSVYFATDEGVAEYSSNSIAPQEDMSGIYAYPNPVRPDYTGLITITGLMEKTLVKITDSVGNVVNSGISNGGMYTWDGCRQSGEAAKSGVYMVFASQSGDTSSSGAVAKILIIR